MSQTFGIETPREHTHTLHRKPARYLIVIDAGGAMVARLCLDTGEMVGEFDAAAQEVTGMTMGLVPQVGALDAKWDLVLRGHSAAERAAAMVYTLQI